MYVCIGFIERTGGGCEAAVQLPGVRSRREDLLGNEPCQDHDAHLPAPARYNLQVHTVY